MTIKDLKGTRVYDRLKKAFDNKESIPNPVVQVSKTEPDIPPNGNWSSEFEDTIVYIERVIAYWSRSLKTAEKNYSPTEREALALKDGLIKFQSFIEGEKVLAITDHAALTWARTYQNVNRRLLTWGTIFAAYPEVKIIHRAGRVYSNVDPISRLRRRIPFQEGPATDQSIPAPWHDESDDPEILKNMFEEIEPKFEARVLMLAKKISLQDIHQHMQTPVITVPITDCVNTEQFSYQASAHCQTISVIGPGDLEELRVKQETDPHFGKIISTYREDSDAPKNYPQYFIGDDGLCYFEDALGGSRLCVPESDRRS